MPLTALPPEETADISVAPDPHTVEYKGTVYRFNEPDPAELIEAVEDRIRKSRMAPIDSILPELHKLKDYPDLQKHLVNRAYEDLRPGSHRVSSKEKAEWIDSQDGIAFILYLCLKPNHPEMTEELSRSILAHEAFVQQRKRRDMITAKIQAAAKGE